MNIALDYDGTYTSQPEMWLRFVLDAQFHGHVVYVVTMRYPSECTGDHSFDHRLGALGVAILATSRKAKKPYCDEIGIPMHIWIDDHPEAVHKDADDIWPTPAPEGCPVVPQYK
jgi:hypothetical protein